jgi:hypothetical protein
MGDDHVHSAGRADPLIGVLQMPGIDSIIYVAAVIAVAALLAYADRKRRL